MNSQTVKLVSESYIKPFPLTKKAKQPIHLGPFDLAMLSTHYIQKGLLFKKPAVENDQENPIQVLVQKLKDSLSVTLTHFYPLAGRLVTKKEESPHSYVVFIDCVNSPGARFVQSKVDLTISDVLSPTYVPSIVQSFFDHDRAISHDGHKMSLLTVQVAELRDGVFVGCSLNHCVADGTSYWHFFNTLSEVFMKDIGNGVSEISRPPNHERWFPDGYGPVFNLPFTHTDQFLSRHEAPVLKEKKIHFSAAALARIKAKANTKCKDENITISSLQALSALMWRCITRVRRLPQDQITNCKLAVNNRSRLHPPLSQNYFGNFIQAVKATTTAGNLLANDLEWAALQLHKAVAEHDDKALRKFVTDWLQSPFVYQPRQFFDPYSVMMGSSPRFDMYGNEFGLGKAVAVLSGYANKFDGKVTLYPGHEGGGSMDLEICLPPHSMTAFECDEEFLDGLNLSG
ncbi:N-hydroxycinnamoyl/benzoyltransferase 6 [Heracleum sosnowskyi]|uniref:N-hydroxycinnamoyl/benzoyltransferase 6 n=1 Tax=Heracleum sosnowskyi TaxID=360622 RepID=A0AAD8IWX8_9APIA|nr:N-hydroxycinnamoyl/benzoyltransferase 6 [Heracleum sosnowskyi]